ncbi:hypothetical protein FXB39_17705 [Nocardioides sp. BGMRC 2183]|nr:hypothetical protein FXB39_17705 [Nocardioides sp. BGMRC 2183]
MTTRLSAGDLTTRAADISPSLRAIIDEHLRDGDELLLHVLMSDLRRWAVSAFYNLDDDQAVRTLLLLLDEALRDGDEAVENAVAVSFVADACSWQPRIAPFLAVWPAALREEADRQQAAD